MQIKLGMKVLTADGEEIGKVDRLIVDPRTEQVKEFVVRKGLFLEHDILIPIGAVDERASRDVIYLLLTADKVKELPGFIESAFVAATPDALYPAVINGGILWPAPIYEPGDPVSSDSIGGPIVPGTLDDELHQAEPESVVISPGTEVKTLEGEKIGTVDDLVIDPKRGKVTEIIVKKGLLHHKEIRIPTPFIDKIEDYVVYVALDKDRLERFTVER